jgi:4-amino-4-deoxy-L-arabinose transferase-like glycosyltransferase
MTTQTESELNSGHEIRRSAIMGESSPTRSSAIILLVSLWAAIFFASLFTPPLLDDADATHANAARHILSSGDWVTLYVNGIRYLEKAPLPYWLDAISFKLFGFTAFAAHLPQAVAVFLLALLGYLWASKAYSPRTGFYTGLAILTSAGVFLFTRVFIPEIWLSLFLATALYAFLQSLESRTEPEKAVILSEEKNSRISSPDTQNATAPLDTQHAISGTFVRSTNLFYPYLLWTSLALAVLTKGLVAPVFIFGTAVLYLALTGEYRQWRRVRPFTGILLFLAIAAPWHILAGLRNENGFLNGHPHGFFWFYFINEHFLRFLGKRYPVDYNKLPGYLFWSLHLVWLFPWALFLPLRLSLWSRALKKVRTEYPSDMKSSTANMLVLIMAIVGVALEDIFHVSYYFTVLAVLLGIVCSELVRRRNRFFPGAPLVRLRDEAHHTTLLLTLYSALVLLFFSFSTNQEYYTFPAYLPLLMLLAACLTRAESTYATDKPSRRWITFAHAALTVIGIAAATALFIGLWRSRHLPFVPDIGELLAHRGVGDYTLSMSHLFDLTDSSFAALRLPAAIAAIAFAFGPAIAWYFRAKRKHLAATSAIALTSATFLIAAHIALIRFGPMLSSGSMADKITDLRTTHTIAPDTQIMLYGDQSYGSSIAFYLGEQLPLVEGVSSSMIFGSSFPDAPHIFLTDADLLSTWGIGPRKLLFVPLERRDALDRVLPVSRQLVLTETSGKALITDRPLKTP